MDVDAHKAEVGMRYLEQAVMEVLPCFCGN